MRIGGLQDLYTSCKAHISSGLDSLPVSQLPDKDDLLPQEGREREQLGH